ncbi:13580_t:CDS:1 [Ambispora leptoticha]|uniref:13580_t:CDS:1 n=1 Tax=Ambispora leptoticha TaxID=144679 RepID=A0A9N9GIX4_9GLOM|nr:13580_t:CDS:1 [Ambispora leptoticha]
MPKDFKNTNFNSFMPCFIRNESFSSIDLDKIDVPYPLDENLVSLLKNNLNETAKRTPNSFILYRKAFKEILIYHGFRLSASEISRQASKNWKALADPVRQEYEKIARELRESTEKCASVISFKNKWRIIKPSDVQRKINKKKNSSLDNLSEPNTVNSFQEPTMTTINTQEHSIFPYPDLSYIDSLFTYNFPETMFLTQNLMNTYPELSMIHFWDNTSITDFQNI